MTPPGDPSRKRSLVALALARRSPLAACGKKSEDVQPARRETFSAWPSTGTRTPTTPGSTWRRSEGYFERRRARRLAQRPDRPVAADQAGRRRQGRPGDLLRARGDAGPRAGPRRGRRRRARRPAADLDDLAEEVEDQAGRGPQGQDDLHRRHPLPGRLPEDDPRPGRPPPTTSSRSTSGRACCRRSLGGRPRPRSGRFWNIEGVDLKLSRQEPGDQPGRQARRAHLRRAGAGRQGQPARGGPGRDPAVHRRPRPGNREPRPNPKAATEARARRQPRP